MQMRPHNALVVRPAYMTYPILKPPAAIVMPAMKQIKINWSIGDGREYETKAEADVASQVANHGGFTVFWITENQERARAADRLVEKGIIEPVDGKSFPWCGYRLRQA